MKLPLLLLPGWLLAAPALAQTAATFASVATYNTSSASAPFGLAVADVNGDGRPDVLTANYVTNTVGVLLGTGTGTFGAIATYSAGPGSSPLSIAVADVNGDGKSDLVTANSGSSTAGVLLGTGTGSFGAVTTYSAGGTPDGIAVADVNGDGKPDLLVANSSSNSTGVLLGTGTGTFGAAATYSVGANSQPSDIYVADVNGDGKLDVLTANYGNNMVGVLLGTGTGTFGAVATYSVGSGGIPYDIVVADVNGDGKPDLITANYGSDAAGVLLGTGTGTFGAATTYTMGTSSQPGGVAVADLNGDGRPDLVTANSGTNTAGVRLGTGAGSFGPPATYSTGVGSSPSGIEVADVNGDNRPDILVTNAATNTVGLLLNTTALPTLAALPGAGSTLYPNPTHTTATLTATGLPAAAAQLTAVLLNPLGQEVRRLTIPVALGAATGSVPTAGLAAGLYLLRLDALDVQGAALGALPTQRLSVE